MHHAVVGLRVLCGDAPATDPWRIDDDIALLRLEDRPWALRDLHELAPRRLDAAVVLAWAYASDLDAQAASIARAQLPPIRAAAIAAATALDHRARFDAEVTALSPEIADRARALRERYAAARHTRRPAVAGVLTAILPGAGQLYAGSLQAAAATFVLNSLFIGTTVELTRDHQYWTASAAGTVASFFYIGGIINAVDLARRRDTLAAQPIADELEQLLVPELSGAR